MAPRTSHFLLDRFLCTACVGSTTGTGRHYEVSNVGMDMVGVCHECSTVLLRGLCVCCCVGCAVGLQRVTWADVIALALALLPSCLPDHVLHNSAPYEVSFLGWSCAAGACYMEMGMLTGGSTGGYSEMRGVESVVSRGLCYWLFFCTGACDMGLTSLHLLVFCRFCLPRHALQNGVPHQVSCLEVSCLGWSWGGGLCGDGDAYGRRR